MNTAEPALHQQQVEILYADHHGWLRAWLRGRLGNARGVLAQAPEGGEKLAQAQEQVEDLQAHLDWLDNSEPQVRAAVEVFERLTETR